MVQYRIDQHYHTTDETMDYIDILFTANYFVGSGGTEDSRLWSTLQWWTTHILHHWARSSSTIYILHIGRLGKGSQKKITLRIYFQRILLGQRICCLCTKCGQIFLSSEGCKSFKNKIINFPAYHPICWLTMFSQHSFF